MKKFIMLLMFIAAIVISYYYVDRTVVWTLFQDNSRRFLFLKVFANDVVTVLLVLVFLVYIYGLVGFFSKQGWKIREDILILCHSVVVAVFLKNVLKVIFGRYWPTTFVCKNPSLIGNHAYGFNWFHSGTAYQSFPSGHTTFIFAFATSLWCLFPKWRGLAVVLVLMVLSGQIGMYYHFVSDVIAGAGLGILVSLFLVTRYQNTLQD